VARLAAAAPCLATLPPVVCITADWPDTSPQSRNTGPRKESKRSLGPVSLLCLAFVPDLARCVHGLFMQTGQTRLRGVATRVLAESSKTNQLYGVPASDSLPRAFLADSLLSRPTSSDKSPKSRNTCPRIESKRSLGAVLLLCLAFVPQRLHPVMRARIWRGALMACSCRLARQVSAELQHESAQRAPKPTCCMACQPQTAYGHSLLTHCFHGKLPRTGLARQVSEELQHWSAQRVQTFVGCSSVALSCIRSPTFASGDARAHLARCVDGLFMQTGQTSLCGIATRVRAESSKTNLLYGVPAADSLLRAFLADSLLSRPTSSDWTGQTSLRRVATLVRAKSPNVRWVQFCCSVLHSFPNVCIR
jgi:hypothetical protein